MSRLIHLLQYIAIKITLFVISLIGIDRASNFGSMLARFVGKVHPVTKVARQNIRQAFPGILREEEDKIVKGMWDNLGRHMCELPYLYRLPEAEFRKRVEIPTKDIENINKYKPAILVGGHFSNLEIGIRATVMCGLVLGITYRKPANGFVDNLLSSLRAHPNITLIAKGKSGGLAMTRMLRDKGQVHFSADQKFNEGLAVPFFGKDAMTTDAPARFAVHFNCPIFPIRVIRKKGAHFKVKVYDAILIEDLESKDKNGRILEITQKINNMFEDWIRETPEQWFWVHRRYEKEFYTK